MDKLIITVAPNGSVPTKQSTPRAVRLAKELQREVATPAEARQILKIKNS